MRDFDKELLRWIATYDLQTDQWLILLEFGRHDIAAVEDAHRLKLVHHVPLADR